MAVARRVGRSRSTWEETQRLFQYHVNFSAHIAYRVRARMDKGYIPAAPASARQRLRVLGTRSTHASEGGGRGHAHASLTRSPLPLSSLTHPPAPPSLPSPKAAPARASSPAPSHANRSLRPRPHNTAIAKIPPIAGYGRSRAIGSLTHKSSQRPQRTPVRRALRSPHSSHRCSLLDDTSRPAGVLMSRMRSLATLSARRTSSASPSHAPASVSRRLIRPHRETTRMHTASRSTARSRSRYLTPK